MQKKEAPSFYCVDAEGWDFHWIKKKKNKRRWSCEFVSAPGSDLDPLFLLIQIKEGKNVTGSRSEAAKAEREETRRIEKLQPAPRCY